MPLVLIMMYIKAITAYYWLMIGLCVFTCFSIQSPPP